MYRASATIRPATTSDLPFLVWAMRTAATSHLERSVWDTLLGLPPGRVDDLFAAVARSTGTHWCHQARFRVAEVSNAPVGALSAFDTATEGSAALEQALLAALAQAEPDAPTLAAIVERSEVLRDVTPADFPATWGIENVAVVEPHRGTGVVDALLTHGLQLGRDRGYRHAQVLCLHGNHRAERSWRRHGFVIRADYRNQRCSDTYGSPGLKLLHRDL